MGRKTHLTLKKRLSKNLMAWPDITALCLELRKSFLKNKFPSMNDRDLAKKIFSEVASNKEKSWTSKKH